VEVEEPEPEYPHCDYFTVSDSHVSEGDYVTLTWGTTNADDVSINNGIGGVNLTGSKYLRVYNDISYTLTAKNGLKTDTCQVHIEVEEEEHNQPRCDAFTISDDDVEEGDYVTLYWSTSYGDEVYINNGIGYVSDDGSESIRVFDDETWTLTVRNDDGVDTCQVHVEVEEEEEVSCDYFTVSDSRVDEGDYITLEWRTTNADDVSINNGIGDVPDDGTERVRVYDDTTFTLTARGDGDTDTCRVTVRVDEEEEEEVSCDSFTVSDNDIDEGDYVTLKWRTTNADDVRIDNGIGDVPDDGSERVRVYRDTTFKLTARGDGDTDTCTVRVRVDEDDDDDEEPRCRLTISDTRISSGEEITLSWNNERTDRAILRDSHGRVLFDTRDDRRIDEDRDEIELRPSQSTDYTLTVYNGNERKECTVGVDVIGGIVAGIRYQETIPLGGTPYTGFEAGPVLTTIFYIVVVLWGLVIGYVLVLRKRKLAGVNSEAVEVAPMPVVASQSTIDATPSTETAVAYESDISADKLVALQSVGHEKRALFSGDALNYIYSLGIDDEERIQKLNQVVGAMKQDAAHDGGWITINKVQVMQILG